MSFLQICRKLSLLYLARYPLGTISTYRSLTLSFVVFKFMLVPPTWNSAKVKVVASHRLALPAAARKMAHEESVTSITPPQSYMCKYVEVERSRYRSAECLAQYCKLFSIRRCRVQSWKFTGILIEFDTPVELRCYKTREGIIHDSVTWENIIGLIIGCIWTKKAKKIFIISRNVVQISYNDTSWNCYKRTYDRSPLNLRASARSLGWIVTRLAWIAARFVSSNSETR